MVQRNYSSPCRTWRSLIALLGLLMASVLPASAAPAPTYARQVGYFTAPVSATLHWDLDCDATDQSVRGPTAIADGVAYGDGSMTGLVFYFPRWSDSGTFIQAGDQQVVLQPRKTGAPNESSSFSAGGTETGGGPGQGVLYVAWALWGSTANCTGMIDDVPQQIHYLDGSHAFLVGPESFTAGAFAQNGASHASAGRAFRTQLKGGPAFAHLKMGSQGEGSLLYDDDFLDVRECRQPYGSACDLEIPRASTLTASILAAAEFGGGSQGEMIVVTLPPDA